MDAQFNVNKNSKTITIRPKPATTVRKESQHHNLYPGRKRWNLKGKSHEFT